MTSLHATVSVIIPVFNSGHSAVAAIRSARAQAYPVYEIIVVDDGSTDSSFDMVVATFGNEQAQIRILRSHNRGAAGARNFGVAHSTGEYAAFLDADDVWLPGKLSRQVAVIQQAETIGMVGALTTMGGRAVSSRMYAPPRKITACMLMYKNYFQTSTVLMRRSALDAVGPFPEGRRYAEEGDLFLRVAARFDCWLLNEVLVDYASGKAGFGHAGLSANLGGMERGELKNLHRSYRRGDSSALVYSTAVIFSLAKFCRRVVLRFFRSIQSHRP